ncbi:restriction endonuclease subunit S [Staphylococcus auricularis]|uniref:restriction endonuclease subunit S n=2 Tax=Staphylococcus TaxID=1279 RepID=UPI003EB720C9
MTKEVKNVPDLRFPGFENTWETKKLHQIVDVKDGTHESPKPTDDGYLLVTSKNLKNSTLDFSESYSISKEDYEDINKRSKVEIGDILFGMIGTIGNPILLEKDGFAIKNVALLKTSSLQEREYILNFLKSNSITKQFYKLNVGGTQKFISLRSIRDLKIDIPSSEEAIKIGGFFNKLDRQIELEEQKLSLLEEQKKGYMQQIFSQQLRFKDENGNDYPGWKEYVLGETGNTYSGLSSKTKEDFGYGDSYFITYMNVFKNTIAKANMTEKVNIQENEKQNKVNYKDILFTTSSEVPEETGMSSIWLYKENNVYLNSFCFGFHVTCDDIEPIYLTRFLRSEKMRKQITILSQGSTRFNISKKEVMKLKIDVPNLEEQTKIVNFLSEYDSLIENQSSKIELLKERKQGFLQKMFV